MNNSVFTFQTLHPDIIVDALFERGVWMDSSLIPLNSYESRVYQFQNEDRRRFVAKFYHPERWTADRILEEHQFTLQLVDGEVPITVPMTPSGQTLSNHQGFYFAVFLSASGRQFEASNIGQTGAAGRYLGHIHQTRHKQLFIHCSTIGLNEYLIKPRKLFEDTTLIPSGLKTAFLKAIGELVTTITTHWQEDFTIPRLHGDYHAGDVLWRDDPISVNLDDIRNDPAAQDLWMLLNGDKAEQRMQLETIIKAYEEFSEFDTAEIGLIEPLCAMHLACYPV